jgi:hypothetical protein
MSNAVADGAVEVLKQLGVMEDLQAVGIEKVLIAPDSLEGVDGASMYVVVGPQAWQQIVDGKPYTYPWWAVQVAGHVALRVAPVMRDNNVTWIGSELLGWTYVVFKGVGIDICDDDATMMFHMGLDAERAQSPVLVVPEDDFLESVSASGLHEVDFSDLAEDDERLVQLGETVDSGPGWAASVITAYPWWEPSTDAKWAQLTFLPSADPAELDDETIRQAVKVTRFGWNLLTNVDLDSEVAEVRRHLASSPVVLTAK